MSIFAEDEQLLIQKPKMSKQELLETEAMFLLSEITTILGVSSTTIVNVMKQVEKKGDRPYAVMGVIRVFEVYEVRMKVFAPFYREHLEPLTRKVAKHYNANQVLELTGTYRLTAVTEHLPFRSYQIRYRVLRSSNPREETGVFKHPFLNVYLVEFPKFSHWVKQMWVQQ